MILNELLTKQNVLNAIILKNGNSELNDSLKVKITRIKIEYGKIAKQFEETVNNFTKTLIPEELKELQAKEESEITDVEKMQMEEMLKGVNSEYAKFLEKKGIEEVSINIDDFFTEEEFDNIICVNFENITTINENKISPEDLLAFFYTLFVNTLG